MSAALFIMVVYMVVYMVITAVVYLGICTFYMVASNLDEKKLFSYFAYNFVSKASRLFIDTIDTTILTSTHIKTAHRSITNTGDVLTTSHASSDSKESTTRQVLLDKLNTLSTVTLHTSARTGTSMRKKGLWNTKHTRPAIVQAPTGGYNCAVM